MSKIRGNNTRPEVIVRRWLHSHGFGYRLNVSNLPGKPDIVLSKYKCIVFINGCFWHRHEGCKYWVIPKTRTDFWLHKITSNVERDKKNEINLRELGWKIIVIWECELKKDREKRLELLNLQVKGCEM